MRLEYKQLCRPPVPIVNPTHGRNRPPQRQTRIISSGHGSLKHREAPEISGGDRRREKKSGPVGGESRHPGPWIEILSRTPCSGSAPLVADGGSGGSLASERCVLWMRD